MAAERAVLVTGASTGIGRAVALRLDAAGWRVYAGVRRQEDARSLQDAASARFTPVLLDVNDDEQVREVADRIDRETGAAGLAGLVNNAGIAVAGPLEFLPLAELRQQLDVNVLGQVAVLQAMMPALRRARGRILFVGSIAGRSALPFTGGYSASKFALEAIADSLRVELQPWGLDVVVIEPGAIATPIWETSSTRAERNMERMPPAAIEYYGRLIGAVRARARKSAENGLPAEVVARVVEKALTTRRPRSRYLIGRDARARLWLERLPDRWRDAVVAAVVRRIGERESRVGSRGPG